MEHRFIATLITGLSSKLTNLRYLDFNNCKALQSCPGLGELVALQEFRLSGCRQLQQVPNLQKLKKLRKLAVGGCRAIAALPGVSDCVSLLQLDAGGCRNLTALPDLRNLRNLRVLDLQYCERIESLPGLDELVCLQSLKTWGCERLTQLPDMHKLTNLQRLQLTPHHPLQSAPGLSDLISLRHLDIGFDVQLHDWPDLRKLTKLETLFVAGWQAQGFSSIANFVLLERVNVHKCRGVRVLPDLQRLTRLQKLEFWTCEFEDMSGLSHLTNLQELDIKECDKLEALPDLRRLTRLKSLTVKCCARLRDFRGVLALRNLEVLWASGHEWLHENLGSELHRLTGLRNLDVSHGGFSDLQGLAACPQLHTLDCSGCPLKELPDLCRFPRLVCLTVRDCVNLTKLTCTGPLSPKLSFLDVQGCANLRALPDLSNSQFMRELHVANSGVVMNRDEFIRQVRARWPTVHLVTELPAPADQPEPSVTTTVQEPVLQPELREPPITTAVREHVLARLLFSLLRCCGLS